MASDGGGCFPRPGAADDDDEATTPAPFTFARDDWPTWIARFERYRRATGLDASPASLLLHMGPRSARLLEEMRRPAEAFGTYEQLVDAVGAHYRRGARANVVLERARFNTRAQRDGEPVEAYIEAVCRLARGCDYGALEAELVRDRLVVGIRDRKCSEALQMEEHLTLEEAKAIVVHAENIKRVRRANADAKCARKGHFAKCCQTSQKAVDKCADQPERSRGAAQKEESFEFI